MGCSKNNACLRVNWVYHNQHDVSLFLRRYGKTREMFRLCTQLRLSDVAVLNPTIRGLALAQMVKNNVRNVRKVKHINDLLVLSREWGNDLYNSY